MRKFISQLLTAGLFAALVCGSAVEAQAQKKGAPKDTSIQGKITAVDRTAKTINIAGKTVIVDSTTEIFKSGRLVGLDAIPVGIEAKVSTITLADKLTAVSIRLGVMAPAAQEPKRKP